MKHFIFYLRYGARPKDLKAEELSLFDSVCEKTRVWETH
jgi:hypothetical protein